jgi:hypothetical protein
MSGLSEGNRKTLEEMRLNEEWALKVGSTVVPPPSVRRYRPGTRGFARPSTVSPENANENARAAADAAAKVGMPVFGQPFLPPPRGASAPISMPREGNQDPEKGGRRKNMKKSRHSTKRTNRKHRKTMKKRKN